MKKRKLKVHRSYWIGKVYSDYSKKVPEIRLKGRWLEQAGFSPSDQVIVEVQAGKLIVHKESTSDGGY